MPALNNTEFKSQIKTLLFQKEKYEFNNNIIGQINKKEFNQSSFNKLGNNLIKKIKLNSITDNKKFKINSVQLLYSLPINSYTLIADEKDDVYIARIIDFEEHSILQDSKNFDAISKEASAQNKNSVLKSYDYLLNDKYKVVINKKTLDRVKNYFK